MAGRFEDPAGRRQFRTRTAANEGAQETKFVVNLACNHSARAGDDELEHMREIDGRSAASRLKAGAHDHGSVSLVLRGVKRFIRFAHLLV